MSLEMMVLAAAVVTALAGLAVTPVLTAILSRQKQKAMEALTAFAQAGLEAPVELRRVVGGK